MLAFVAMIIAIWLAFELIYRPSDDDGPRRAGLSRMGWLAVGSLVFSLIMAKLGFPFFFLILPPIFFVFRSDSKED
jgi:hypothetical protein